MSLWLYCGGGAAPPPQLSGTPTHPGKHTNTLAFPFTSRDTRGRVGVGGGRFASPQQRHIYLYKGYKRLKKLLRLFGELKPRV